MDVTGTILYIAPEVFSQNYGVECDIWSLGVTIFALISGKVPFNGESHKKIEHQIKTAEVKFPKHFSLELKNLLRKMLAKNPEKRISIPEILDNNWLKKNKVFSDDFKNTQNQNNS